MKLRKKAQLQIPGAIVDIYAIIGFVLVLLVFILLFQIQGCGSKNRAKAEITSRAEKIDANLVLLNYLRTPVNVDGIDMDMADLIVLWNSEFTKAQVGENIIYYRTERNAYSEKLMNETGKFLSSAFDSDIDKCSYIHPAYFERHPYSPIEPFVISNPEADPVACKYIEDYDFAYVKIPSFNEPESRTYKTSISTVALKYPSLK
ncbi:hypothetical protein KY342_04760 [Candidatus Woesearchaeota archaeon]|nr:hypothetical protein [Candidatus Woesearchaeota archaeon]